jgi:hypothetical protein
VVRLQAERIPRPARFAIRETSGWCYAVHGVVTTSGAGLLLTALETGGSTAAVETGGTP